MGGHGKGDNRVVRGFSKVARTERFIFEEFVAACPRLSELGTKKDRLPKEAVFIIP
jgi:hypothetical protein